MHVKTFLPDSVLSLSKDTHFPRNLTVNVFFFVFFATIRVKLPSFFLFLVGNHYFCKLITKNQF